MKYRAALTCQKYPRTKFTFEMASFLFEKSGNF